MSGGRRQGILDYVEPTGDFATCDLTNPTCPRCGHRIGVRLCYRKPFGPVLGIAICPQKRQHFHFDCRRCGIAGTATMPQAVKVESWSLREVHGPWEVAPWDVPGLAARPAEGG